MTIWKVFESPEIYQVEAAKPITNDHMWPDGVEVIFSIIIKLAKSCQKLNAVIKALIYNLLNGNKHAAASYMSQIYNVCDRYPTLCLQ